MLKDKISSYILSVTIDLEESRQELMDAQIKFNELSHKLNDLIKMQDKLKDEDSNNSNSVNSDSSNGNSVGSSTNSQ